MSISIFEQIKQQVDIKDAVEHYSGDGIVSCGSNTYQLDSKECPLCAHKDCFKIHDQGAESYYKCFSCDRGGDVINFVQTLEGFESVMEAVEKIEKDFELKLVRPKSTMTDIERVFVDAADYYSECLFSSNDILMVESEGYTPLDYQVKVRKHHEDWLRKLKVGYSDGSLGHYLQGIGHSPEALLSSGLCLRDSRGVIYDFFQQGLIIYPHFTLHRVSSFSQKDPRKKSDYQFPSKFRINGCLFYGQETIEDASKVIIVEGQNDRISLLEAGFEGAVLATCGSISGKQLEWMKENLAGKQVLTSFDSDDAGEVYRRKLAKITKCSHIKFPPTLCNDVDEFLTKINPDLSEVFKFVEREVVDLDKPKRTESTATDEAPQSVSVPVYDKDLKFVEKNGCYYRIKVNREGEETLVQITDFVIKLRNIFLSEGKRVREAEILRIGARKGAPILVDSETKTSIKFFRTKVADACDATFMGNESDLLDMWRYIYRTNTEKTVFLPDHVGRVDLDGGWLFGNAYISSEGEVIKPDDKGVMWLNGNLTGIRPVSISEDLELDVYSQGSRNIPKLNLDMMDEEVRQVEKSLVVNYAKNLGDPGNALLILGWAKLNAFSNRLFQAFGFTPFLFLWGNKGVGKTSLIHWILSIYSMKTKGYDTLPNLRSGVGFERKLAYFASLPVCLDELRAGRDMSEFTGRFRAWYNRSGRSMAGQGSKRIIQQVIRSNFIFGGQDMFNDDALRERCVVIRLPREGREMVESYQAITRLEATDSLSAIGFKWIKEAQTVDYEEILEGIERITSVLLASGCAQRTARVWACIAYFSKDLGDSHLPDFDFNKFLINSCVQDVQVQTDNGFINKFFETLEGLFLEEHSHLTANHFKVSDGKLYMWFVDIWRVYVQSRRDMSEELFSREAIKNAIKEEKYFLEESVTRMGLGVHSTSKRVLVFDINEPSFPTSLHSIVDVLSGKSVGEI